jgi:hypothetical protein
MRINRHPLDRASRGDAERFINAVLFVIAIVVLTTACIWISVAGAAP